MGQNGSKASSVFSTMFQVKKDHLESDDKLSFPASITRFIPRSPSMSGSSFRTCDAASTVVKLNIKMSQGRMAFQTPFCSRMWNNRLSCNRDNIQFYCQRETLVYATRLWRFVIRRFGRQLEVTIRHNLYEPTQIVSVPQGHHSWCHRVTSIISMIRQFFLDFQAVIRATILDLFVHQVHGRVRRTSLISNNSFIFLGWIPGFLNSVNESEIWMAQIVEFQRSFKMIPKLNQFPEN